MDMSSTVIEDIERRQLIWYGHVRRMPDERLPKKVMEWEPEGRRKIGRPKKSWMEGVRKAMSSRDLTDADAERRDVWKSKLGTG